MRLTALQHLQLTDNPIAVLPPGVVGLTMLRSLGLKGTNIRSLPFALPDLLELKTLKVRVQLSVVEVDVVSDAPSGQFFAWACVSAGRVVMGAWAVQLDEARMLFPPSDVCTQGLNAILQYLRCVPVTAMPHTTRRRNPTQRHSRVIFPCSFWVLQKSGVGVGARHAGSVEHGDEGDSDRAVLCCWDQASQSVQQQVRPLPNNCAAAACRICQSSLTHPHTHLLRAKIVSCLTRAVHCFRLAKLPPQLALLSSLETLEVDGNPFRPHIQDVISRGLKALMKYLAAIHHAFHTNQVSSPE